MNERKRQLIEAGMKLFAQKGYHRTSIQEIAHLAGVSKGTFYIYFPSKEAFVETSTHYVYIEIKQKIAQVCNEEHSPRQNLSDQIAVLITCIEKYKDFIVMQIRENITIGDSVERLIDQIKVENYQWLRTNILSIYGDRIDSFFADTVIQLEGLIHNYSKWIIEGDIEVDVNQMGAFIVRRLDDVVNGMMQEKTALFHIDDIPAAYKAKDDQLSVAKHAAEIIFHIKEKIKILRISKGKKEQLDEAVHVLEHEVKKTDAQAVVIQGLLAHLKPIQEVEKECRELAQIFNVELLN